MTTKISTRILTILCSFLSIVISAQPSNDDCTNAISINITSTPTSYDNNFDGATSSGITIPSCESEVPLDVWYNFTTSSSGNILLQGSNGNFDLTGFTVYSGTCTGLVEEVCGFLQSSLQNPLLHFQFLELNPNQSYFIRFWDDGSNYFGERIFRISAGQAITNKVCSSSISINVQSSCVQQENIQIGFGGLSNVSLPSCDDFNFGLDPKDVWYDFIAPSSGAVNIITSTSTTNVVYSGTCASLSEFSCQSENNDTYINGLQSGQTYYLRILNNTTSVASLITDVCIVEAIQPTTNDLCTDAIPITVGSNCNTPTVANFYNATFTAGGFVYCNDSQTTQRDIWFSFSPTNTGAFYIDSDAGFNAGLFENDCGNLVPITTCFGTADVMAGLDPSKTYLLKLWVHNTIDAEPRNFCLIETTGPANNFCEGAIELNIDLNCTPITVNFDNLRSSTIQTPSCKIFPKDQWYNVEVPANGKLKIGYLGNVNQVTNSIGLYSGTCNNVSLIQCISPSDGILTLTGLTPNSDLIIRLESVASTSSTNIDFCVSAVGNPPANNLCINAEGLSLSNTTCDQKKTGLLAGATDDTDFCVTDKVEVFYSFTAPITGNYSLSVLNNATDINLGEIDACNGNLLGCGLNEIVFTLNGGDSRIFEVSATNNNIPTAFDICLKPYESSSNESNVGIGITDPIQKLHVSGGIALGNTIEPFPGSMRYTGQDFEGYVNGQWNSMTTINGDQLGNHTATQDLNMNNNAITNLSLPQSSNDAATKAYVDTHNDGDNLSTNEIQTISLNGTQLSLSRGGGSVLLPGVNPDWNLINNMPSEFADGIDNVIDNDNDPMNEIETWSTLAGKPSGFADGVDNVIDGDSDDENEKISEITLSGIDFKLSEGGQTFNVDFSDYLNYWNKDGSNNLRYFSGNVMIGNNSSPSDKFNVVNGGIDVLFNSSASNAHLDILETGSSDGARINFENTNSTTNKWTLYGRSSNTSSSNVFNVVHNLTGNIMTIEGNTADVGFGGDPISDLHVFQGNNSSTDGIMIQNTSDNSVIRMYVSSGSDDLRFYSSAQGLDAIANINDVTGAYTALSDRRKKENIEALNLNWENFMKINPVNYTFINDKNKRNHIGLIAQEMNALYPEVVEYFEDDDLFHLNYSEVGVVAIKAIQEQQKIIKSQAEKLKEQEVRLIRLEKIVRELQSNIE